MSEAIVHAEARGHEAGHHELGFLRTYIFSTDHKMIGKQFLTMGLAMLVLGGILALLVRWELAWPETAVPGMHWVPEPTMYDGIIPPETYNAFFTMHATIMIFFAVMPILVGCFGNFLIPLMIGARDMAFPLLERPLVLDGRARRHPDARELLRHGRRRARRAGRRIRPSARSRPTAASTGDRTSGASA